MTTTPDRARVRLADISPRAYEHPADRAALSALRKVRGFDQMLRWLSGVFAGRTPRLLARRRCAWESGSSRPCTGW